MTRADLAAIRAIVREEVERAIHSGPRSTPGIVGPSQEDRCNEESEFMDPTSTELGGESYSSIERQAREDVARMRRGLPLRPTSRPRGAKRKAAGR